MTQDGGTSGGAFCGEIICCRESLKTGSENIEATLRRRSILFTGFVARMEDTRLPKCVMFGDLVGGAGCVRGAGKRVDGVFPG